MAEERVEQRPDGTWVFHGPNGTVEQPSCFGEWWEGAGVPYDPEDRASPLCPGCKLGKQCLDVFAQGKLAATIETMAKSLGRDPQLGEVGQRLELNVAAIGAACDRRQQLIAEQQEQAADEQAAPEEESEMPTRREAPTKKATPKKKVAKKKVAKKAADKAPDPVEPEPAPEVAPEPEKAPAAKKKATKKTKKGAASRNPPPAGSAKRVRALAESKKTTKSAPTAKAQAGRSRGEEWGEHTHNQRCEREREKNPLLQLLVPGEVLKVERNGHLYTLKVMKHGYKYLEKIYPTLYMAAKVAAGTKPSPVQYQPGVEIPAGKTRQLSAWSGPKFWKLEQHLKARGKI